MKTFALLTLVFLTCLSASAQFKGRVYTDRNHSKSFDKGDVPISDVSVTDGRNVVRTDKKGCFSLPGYAKTRFISITTPSGYEAEQFYMPIGKEANIYEFILTESKRTLPREHSFLQITDTEATGGLGRWVTDLKQYAAHESSAFIIHTGDICYEAGQKMHQKVVNTQTMDCPVYYCLGNHDLVKGKYGEELYESLFGPTWYSFDAGNTHYVVTPISHGDFQTDYTKEDVYNWLKNDLAMMRKGQSLIVFNHDLFTSSDTFVFKYNDQHQIDFRDYNIKAEIYGHMHYNYVRNQAGIYTICTGTLDKGGIDHSPSAFREICVDGNDSISTQLRYTFIAPQTVIVCPMNGQYTPAMASGKIPVSVNTYHSQAKTRQVSYVLSHAENNKEITRGEIHLTTDWNWAGEIAAPSRLNGKNLKLTVTATFNDGQTATATNSFTYQSNSLSSVKPEEDWTTLLQNAAHTGGINTSQIKLPLQQAWINNAGANIFMTSPLIADSKVFTATTHDEVPLSASVCAFDLQSGKRLWEYRTENSVKNTIAYEDGVIVAQDAACNLYAIDASSGKLIWKQYIDLQAYPYLTEGLTINKGIIYAGIGTGLSAYDLKTGHTIWTNKDWRQREGSTTTLTVAGDVLISGSQWGGLYANDIHSGKQLWKLSDDGLSNRGASPVYKDGMLWIISSKSLFIIEPKTGQIMTKKEFSANLDVTSTPLVTEHEIIFGTAERGVMALDRETLFIKWKAETQPSLVYTAPYSTTPLASLETSPVASQGIVYIGASDGYLYAIDQHTGIIKEKLNLGAPVFSTVAVSGNNIIVTDFSGNIYSFVSKLDMQ